MSAALLNLSRRATLAELRSGRVSRERRPLLVRVATLPAHRYLWLPYGVLLFRNEGPEWLAMETPLYVGCKLVVTLEAIGPGAVGRVLAKGADFVLPKRRDEHLATGSAVGWDASARCLSRRNVPSGCGFAAVRATAPAGTDRVRVRLCNYVHPEAVMAD